MFGADFETLEYEHIDLEPCFWCTTSVYNRGSSATSLGSFRPLISWKSGPNHHFARPVPTHAGPYLISRLQFISRITTVVVLRLCGVFCSGC